MSKRFIAFLLGCFVIVGAAFFALLRWGSQVPLFSDVFSGGVNQGAGPMPGPAAPKPTNISIMIQHSANGNMFMVLWENLPQNATALDIFRSTKGKNDWSLWKTVKLNAGELGDGSASFNIGTATFANYSFYVEAVGNGTGGGPGGSPVNSQGEPILWISSSTEPVVVPAPPTPPPSVPPNNQTTTPPQAPSSSPPIINNTSTPPAPPSPPPGIPYYTPAIKISGYGLSQAGSFWVQHVDQKIEIGWQNLPPETTSIVIARSLAASGPWSTILTQENPSGSYSIQVVDNTLGQAYYYEMTALAGSSTVAIYGPISLPPVGQ